MHLLTFEISRFCVFLVCVFDRDSLELIQAMLNSAAECITVDTRKITCLAGNELNVTGID